MRKQLGLQSDEDLLNGTTISTQGGDGEIILRYYEGSYYHLDTPPEVSRGLNMARIGRLRVKLYLGDRKPVATGVTAISARVMSAVRQAPFRCRFFYPMPSAPAGRQYSITASSA